MLQKPKTSPAYRVTPSPTHTDRNPFMMSHLSPSGDPIPDILFVFPPLPRNYEFTYHLGAGYIRAHLQQHHLDAAQFITSKRRTVPDTIRDIRHSHAHVIGFTCYDANYPYVRLFARYLKKKHPHLTILLGGPTATFSPHVIMNHTPEIDVCIRGEGEQTTLELLQKGFSDVEDLESIQGITFRSNGRIISTPPRPLISSREKGAELDMLPSPYLTGLIPPDGTTGILTARGCVYHCTYCSFSTMFCHTIRYHSIERVTAELELIAAHWDPRTKENVMIHDDIFSLNIERAKAICQAIIDRGIRLPLSLETRADNCDKELIDLMRDAGVVTINFGLESASGKVLRMAKKTQNEEHFLRQIKNAVHWAQEAGIETSVSTIFGLPGEGLEEARETLEFVKGLNVGEYYHNILFLFAGTELFRERRKYGLKAVHSPTFLPLETKHTYDVENVEPLPNAGIFRQVNVWKRMYCDLLCYGVGEEYTSLVIRKMPEDRGQLCRWLHDLCALHLSVVDTTAHTGRREAGRMIKTLLDGGVPLGFYSVVRGEGRSRLLRLYSVKELKTVVPEIPFHQWEEGGEELVTLETEEDVRALAECVDAHTEDGILIFAAQELPKMVVDACRWGGEVCPALLRGALVVEGDEVLSCFHGGWVGKVGEDVATMRKRVEDLINEKKKESGCTTCQAKDCSCCLFPHFFTDMQFCALKRKYSSVPKVIPLLEWLYVYAGGSNAVVRSRVDERALPLFYRGDIREGEPLPEVVEGVHLISFGGDAVAFVRGKSYSLDMTKAAMLEACALGVGREVLTASLSEEGAVIDEVLFVFEQLGLVKS